MKSLLPFFCLVILIACNNQKKQPAAGVKLFLLNDSGFIQKENGLAFLLAHKLTDTFVSKTETGSYWDYLEATDTIGKYYRDSKTGNFIVCMLNYETANYDRKHLLMEIKPDGTIVKQEAYDFLNGIFWDEVEGFKKYNDYYCLTVDGDHGPGYYSEFFMAFKKVIARDQQNTIPRSYWSAAVSEVASSLSSEILFSNDSLIVHYTLETGRLDDLDSFNIRHTEQFDVIYTNDSGYWRPNDESHLKKLDLQQDLMPHQ